MKFLVPISGVAAALLSLSVASAPIVSLDADPGTAGVQNSIIVAPNSTFAVDIVVSGVEVAQPLQGFEFDLGFDSAVMTALSVVEGGFLQGPFGTSVVENDVIVPDVNFAVTALGTSTTVGDGVLATVSFLSSGSGNALLDLSNVILSAFPSTAIQLASVNDGRVTVQPSGGTAPLPGTLALLVLGLSVVGAMRKWAQGS